MTSKELKIWQTAPLPFQGQKRMFIQPFKKALNEMMSKNKIDIIVDLFGGSGLLSHIAKRLHPDCRVIYNDYDNFNKRLLNIDKTNMLLSDIRDLLGDYPRNKKIIEPFKKQIIKRIADEENKGYVDYITLSASLLFAGKYAISLDELQKHTLYNTVKRFNYEVDSMLYLSGLEITSNDYQLLFNQFKNMKNVLFFVDPPYLSTDTKSYNSDKYWKLADYLNVLNVLKDTNYIFFTSNKSSIIELCDWFSDNYKLINPLKDAQVEAHHNYVNGDTKSYIDYMIYKTK